MAVSAHDVARELRQRLPDVGAVKVHKLLYLCQGWYLAWTRQPLFGEEMQAWDNGPVVPSLWHAEDKGQAIPRDRPLEAEMVLVLDYVVSRYGRLSGRELIDLTHAEEPWQEAVAIGGPNAEITQASLVAFFAADEELNDVQALAARIATSDLERAVEAVSRPRNGPVRDDSESLREMLSKLA